MPARIKGAVRWMGTFILRALVVPTASRIDRSGLFDRQWYRERYPDAMRDDLDPVVHYILDGARLGYDPHPLFHTSFYLAANRETARWWRNPLAHYCRSGAFQYRDPSPHFDSEWYLAQNPDVAASREIPLAHYLRVGAAQGRDPNSLFDSDWYLARYPEAAASGMNPLVHYVCIGRAKGLLASPKLLPPSGTHDGRLVDAGDRFDYATEAVRSPAQLRSSILDLIARAASQRRTPFYDALGKIVSDGDPAMLGEIKRTLQEIDLAPPKADAGADAKPLVSVVLPVHNRRDLVGDAIRSVLAQTYPNFELIVCDDGSDDGTSEVVSGYAEDKRVKIIQQDSNAGAAAARNRCLERAKGRYIAYLDSDNIWHPHYLAVMVAALSSAPGQPVAYCSYIYVSVDNDRYRLVRTRHRDFSYRLQSDSPFVDLNSVVHHRALYDMLGGFDRELRRLQDHDLFARYCWLRDPQLVPYALNIYRRISGIGQISEMKQHYESSRIVVRERIANYYRHGVGARIPRWVRKVSVLSWDMSRNHFAKAYSVAEALSRDVEVELISFQFFEDPIFRPLANKQPPFPIRSFSGAQFPAFFKELSGALDAITGDVIYAVKPRLPSLGLALLANHRRRVPVLLEANDLETVIETPRSSDRHLSLSPEEFLARVDEARSPHAAIWSQLLDPLASQLPLLFTHNRNLNRHYHSKCLYMRNIKDESVFDPSLYDRTEIRRELGLEAGDRMILFGGLVRRHKGMLELARWIEMANDARLKLFVVGSQDTQELRWLSAAASASITVLPPQPADRMAAINLAADAVILWLDPDVPASHYQMPYKFTDAIAMGTPVISSPLSDLADLGDVVWLVPYGDFSGLSATLQRIFSDDAARAGRCAAGRNLYLKEFSYSSARECFALGCTLIEDAPSMDDVSERFTEIMMRFSDRFAAGREFRAAISQRTPSARPQPGTGR